jgi:Tfp pilus assembly protein PilN
MRAVNLIPGEAGRNSGGGSIAPYALIGVLAVVLVAALAYVLTHNTLVERRAELASVQTQAQQLQTQAAAVKPYRAFAQMAEARVETVRQLGATRFDWHRAFDNLATVLPNDIWLTSLLGTVTNGVSVEGSASGSTGTLRAALPNPAIELSGCATGQDQVARLISRLRLMKSVTRVSLSDSIKVDGGTASTDDSNDCTHGNSRFPRFGIVVFFDAPPTATAPVAGGTTGVSTTPPATGTPSTASDMR